MTTIKVEIVILKVLSPYFQCIGGRECDPIVGGLRLLRRDDSVN